MTAKKAGICSLGIRGFCGCGCNVTRESEKKRES